MNQVSTLDGDSAAVSLNAATQCRITTTRQFAPLFSPHLCQLSAIAPSSRHFLRHIIRTSAPTSRLPADTNGGNFALHAQPVQLTLIPSTWHCLLLCTLNSVLFFYSSLITRYS